MSGIVGGHQSVLYNGLYRIRILKIYNINKMDIILEIMAKAIRSCYGFVPEAYLIHMLLVCTFLVLVAREYMRNKIDDDILHANTNRLGV